MKKIKLSVVGLLLSGLSYGQEYKQCCVKTIQDVYQYEGMVMSEFRKDSVKISYIELSDLFNDLDEMMSWFKEDENNGDFSHGSVEEEWGHIWLVNLWMDKIEQTLSEHSHKVHLNK